MRIIIQCFRTLRALRSLLPVSILAVAPVSPASTVWSGPNTNFTQSSSRPTDVLIPGAVSFTRAGTQWLYNPAGGDAGPGTDTPTDTMWAMGAIANYQSLTYKTFASYRNGDLSSVILNKPMVVH